MTTPPQQDSSLSSITHADVSALMRNQNWKLGAGFLAVLLLVGITAWLAGGGRSAAEDNLNATRIQLANNERNACVSERRNAQAAAVGDMVEHGLAAQKAGLVDRDDARLTEELRLYAVAVKARHDADVSLSPEVLNEPPPQGCGAPITTVDQLNP